MSAEERIAAAREETSKLLRMLEAPEPGIAMWWVALDEVFSRARRALEGAADSSAPPGGKMDPPTAADFPHFPATLAILPMDLLCRYLAALRGNSLFLVEMEMKREPNKKDELFVQCKFVGNESDLPGPQLLASLKLALAESIINVRL